jgi:hypothetical protein
MRCLDLILLLLWMRLFLTVIALHYGKAGVFEDLTRVGKDGVDHPVHNFDNWK